MFWVVFIYKLKAMTEEIVFKSAAFLCQFFSIIYAILENWTKIFELKRHKSLENDK